MPIASPRRPLSAESSLFGTSLRSQVLVALALLDETYPRELSTLLERPIAGVLAALRRFEADGIIESIPFGRQQRVRLSRRWFARDSLHAFLVDYAPAFPDLVARIETVRRRARRRGKGGLVG